MHIIIFDEFGNEIGRMPDEPPVGGGGGNLVAEEDHPARKLILNLGFIRERLFGEEKKSKHDK